MQSMMVALHYIAGIYLKINALVSIGDYKFPRNIINCAFTGVQVELASSAWIDSTLLILVSLEYTYICSKMLCPLSGVCYLAALGSSAGNSIAGIRL